MKTTFIPPLRSTNKCLRIPTVDVFLLADLQVPREATTLVIFAYEFGRSRNHPRARLAARVMREYGFGTLLCDLLTEDEETEDEATGKYRNDARLLAKRLLAATRWAAKNEDTKGLRIAYFGVCTGAAAAMIAAAKSPKRVAAVVSRGGRLDLATDAVRKVCCPTLLIVGENDLVGTDMSRDAFELMTCDKEMLVVPGASHLFGEPGKLESMARTGALWLRDHLDDQSRRA